MKIGTLTLFHKNYNWGGVLQGYALKYYLEKQYPDMEVDILQYHSGSNIVYKGRVQQALQYSPIEIFKKVTGRIKNKKQNIPAEFDLSNRKQMFDSFMNAFRTNPRIYNDSNLLSAAKEYDCLITGSDQIWNPNVARPGYFLISVKNECKKVAYAASIARDDLSPHERKVMIPLIERFDYVSVREKTAKDFLSKYTHKEIKEVLDPALMLTSDEWTEIAAEKSIKDKYVLAFFFSESIEYRKKIEVLCKEQGYKLVFIPFAANKYIASDLRGECERMYDVGPKEFIRLFMDAEFVFTDSFHGSVFAILFKKNFVVFERDKNNKVSKNSRLYDLLDKFNLSSRLVRTFDQFHAVVEEKIDFGEVYELLENYRKESKAFLNEALGESEVSQ